MNAVLTVKYFYSWVEQVLLPELPQNSVIVMDNATFHKRQDIQYLIQEHHHTILVTTLLAWTQSHRTSLSWMKGLRQGWRLDSIDDLFFYLCGYVPFFTPGWYKCQLD